MSYVAFSQAKLERYTMYNLKSYCSSTLYVIQSLVEPYNSFFFNLFSLLTLVLVLYFSMFSVVWLAC